jgi:pyruvate formate lyase activating enzyme
MKYYQEIDGSERLRCILCQHYCSLKVGQSGICGVNKNVGDRVENLVYGRVAAINIDPIEKKPLYHFEPTSKSLSFGTVGCNFKCSFCQNWGISQEKNIDIKSKNMTPLQIVDSALQHGCRSISYTYNEPTIFWPFIKDVAILAKQNGLKNIIVTNGYESKEVCLDMKGLIDGANIDLKSFDAKYYKKDLGGNLEGVKNTISLMHKIGIWIEITTLVVPTKNSSSNELNSIASFIASIDRYIPWHISAFHPDFKELDIPKTSLDTLLKAYDIGKDNSLEYIYLGNIGLHNITYCKKCGTDLIERKGYKTKILNLKSGCCTNCSTKLEGVYE